MDRVRFFLGNIKTAVIYCVLAVISCGNIAMAENWPQWRGPRGDGTSAEKGLPTQWDKTTNIAWAAEIPGEGHSSPIVFEDKVYLTSGLGDGHERVVICVDAKTGKILWTQKGVTTADLESHHSENNFASSTSAVDANGVYSSFYGNKVVNVTAHAHDGKLLWHATPLKFEGEHGYNYTPTQTDDLVILTVNQFAEPATIALSKKDGKVVWKNTLGPKSCSNVPPIIIQSEGKPQLITVGNSMTFGLDPSTGQTIWSYEGPTDYCVAGPAFGNNILLTNGGYPERRAVAINTTGRGNVTGSDKIVWERKKGTTYVPSPVFKDGYFYSVTDDGIATCTQSATGTITWTERIGGHVRPSLILSEDNIYTTNDDGVTTIFKAKNDAYQMVSKSSLDEFTYASPAASNGKIYIRTKTKLYCIGK